MTTNRRDFFVLAGAASLAPLATATTGEAQTAPAPQPSRDDGLAHPVPYRPAAGQGRARGLVLGGGGIYLASWMVAYFTALAGNGIDVGQADIIVGTSAGSLVGAVLAGGRLADLEKTMQQLAGAPEEFAKFVPLTPPTASQLRAREASNTARLADSATIQAIGRAAMAARNPAGPAEYRVSLEHFLGMSAWPSEKLHTTAVDCFTGERIVVSQADGLQINDGCAASSSLPGSQGPTWLKDRLCMDGGISESSTHCDVVAGIKRALVISLTDGTDTAVKLGLRASSLPNTLKQEVQQLQADGTQVALKIVGLVPGVERVDSIMNPKWIAPCLANGRERGLADVAEMRAFWGA
jgi:NTE family protein